MQTVTETDTICRCEVCQRETSVSLERCLRLGWPYCHNQAMQIVSTTADVPELLAQAIQPLTEIAAAALRAWRPKPLGKGE
jgi:hypothetical protein